MTPASCLAIPDQIPGLAARDPRAWATKLWRGLLFCSLLSIVFMPEFVRNGADAGLPIYAKVGAGFRLIDVAILLVAFCHLVSLGCLRAKALRFPRTLAWPGLAFLVCVAVAAAYGKSRGGSNFFFDWRGLSLGIGLYFVWSFWLQNEADVAAAIRLFAVYMALRIGLLYLLYFAGYRETLLGISIPVFDGPVLSCIVFAALLAFSYQGAGGAREKIFWSCLAAAAYLIVLLCFRRTYWGELGIGTLILLWRRGRNRIRNLILLGITVSVAAWILGGSFSSRLQSLDITRDDTQFSADNADHFNDLVDGWDQVRQAPVMGIGLGTSYPTWHIRNWKPESVMVHNAPLHVWLKYGLAGLICYLWFHLALLRWLCRRSKVPMSRHGTFLSAAFAYLAAQFVMTLGFAPWPYSELQLTVLISFILAAAVIAGQTQLRSNL